MKPSANHRQEKNRQNKIDHVLKNFEDCIYSFSINTISEKDYG